MRRHGLTIDQPKENYKDCYKEKDYKINKDCYKEKDYKTNKDHKEKDYKDCYKEKDYKTNKDQHKDKDRSRLTSSRVPSLFTCNTLHW